MARQPSAEVAAHRERVKRLAIQRNRDTRAWKLWRWLKQAGVTFDEVRGYTDDEWLNACRGAKLKIKPGEPNPGPETRGQVIGLMTPRQWES